ncbi:hypothetical protein ACSBR2_007675 [Camellia fascicularis]
MESILCRRDLPSFCHSRDLDDPSMKLIVKEVEQIPLGFGLILNTFEELEESILSHIRSLCPNLYPIDPLHAHLKARLGAAEPEPRLPLTSSNSLWQEDRICMTWLDAQPPKFVIYVTIGSLAMMTSDQGMELTRFLTHSGWNSTLKSMVEGLLMVCWPYFVDQQVNSRFVSEVWKLGVDKKDTCDQAVIERMIKNVMDAMRDCAFIND